MADSFDPYQEWLGISPFEPPPNHYRLLGLRPFEESTDVIQQTVIRLMARLKNLAANQPEAVTRRVIADLSAARDCLINPETKAAYDRALREQNPNLSSIQRTAITTTETVPLSGPARTVANPLSPGVREDDGETVIFQGPETRQSSSAIGSNSSIAANSANAESSVSGVNLPALGGASNKPSKTKLIGEYVILERIGIGGMGQVFKAQHRKNKTIVAIKILPPQSIKSVESIRRFYREVEAAAKLKHPNIVAAFDAGEQNGIHYLVMEFVDGKDLAQILKQEGPLPIDKVVEYMRQAATGLAYAHGEGIVHRDIKPANLLLNSQGQIKVLDMGLASNDQSITLVDAASKDLTGTGQIMGTLDYMSPEQSEDTHQADARSDIYSLGCTMYRLLTNEFLYRAETAMKKVLAHRSAPIPSLKAMRAEVPAGLEVVFLRMVAKSPADRYATMEELIVALDNCLRPTPAPPRVVPPRTVPPRAAPQRTVPPRTLPRAVAVDLDTAPVSPSEYRPEFLQTEQVANLEPLAEVILAESEVALPFLEPPQTTAAAPSRTQPSGEVSAAWLPDSTPHLTSHSAPRIVRSHQQPRNWFVVGSIVAALLIASICCLMALKMFLN